VCESCGQSLVRAQATAGKVSDSICEHSVEVLQPRPPVSVLPSDSVRHAIRRMAEHNVGAVLVLEEQKPVGVFTERDVLLKTGSDLDGPVSKYMTPDPQTLSQNDSVAYALHEMDVGGYRHLPIVDESGNATGMVSVRDVLHYLCHLLNETKGNGV
ncbi:MAG TPA: CBS domain-containing protein, partial [Planctomycetaceae bacterium]|nr:CBS domain-containing protein [Planctomycetaceae bacterium]